MLIFCAKESWDHVWKNSKVFYPLTSFYLTFLALKFAQISRSKLIFNDILTLRKWGKKLVRGVKTFDFFRAWSQLSFAQKIILKSLKLVKISFFEKIHIQNNFFVFFVIFQNFEIWKFSKNFQIFFLIVIRFHFAIFL